ncbi:MAG: DUF721 domain-containing protein [bacterium]|nr:DUF721 domain-containing protein [bacterium]
MSFTKVSDLLSNVAARSGDPIALEAARVVEVVQKNIGNILGEKAIGNVRVKNFKDGVLTLSVVSSVWAHEVRMKERKLVFNLHEILQKGTIKKVRYWVG